MDYCLNTLIINQDFQFIVILYKDTKIAAYLLFYHPSPGDFPALSIGTKQINT